VQHKQRLSKYRVFWPSTAKTGFEQKWNVFINVYFSTSNIASDEYLEIEISTSLLSVLRTASDKKRWNEKKFQYDNQFKLAIPVYLSSH
jgi:hypothetical protein